MLSIIITFFFLLKYLGTIDVGHSSQSEKLKVPNFKTFLIINTGLVHISDPKVKTFSSLFTKW